MEAGSKTQSFQDLHAWKESQKLVIVIYEITKNFPKEEIFGLTLQIKRAVISITSNIAEGYSRNYFKEKLQFYFIALGSLSEVQNQLLAAKALKFIDANYFSKAFEQTIVVSKLLNGLIKSTKNIIHNS